jgi:hypothetical protein
MRVMITTSASLSSDTLSRAVLDTPDGIFTMLISQRWEPCASGWRDPDDGTVVPWQEAARRLRRRAR